MAYFKCGSGGSSVEIDGVEYDGDLKLKSSEIDVRLNNMPIELSPNGNAIVYNDEIHIIYLQNHFKWNGSKWESVSTLPISVKKCACIVFNGELHVLGSDSNPYTCHYKWNGSTWTSVSTLPYDTFRGPYTVAILNGYLHIFGSNYSYTSRFVYRFNGSSWSSVGTIPYDFLDSNCLVTLNNEVHLFGLGSNVNYHYKWDGSTWTNVSTIPYEFYYGIPLIIDDEIHIFGGGNLQNYLPVNGLKHLKYDGSQWINLKALPFYTYNGRGVVLNNKIYLLGSNFKTYSDRGSSALEVTNFRKIFYELNKKIYEIAS